MNFRGYSDKAIATDSQIKTEQKLKNCQLFAIQFPVLMINDKTVLAIIPARGGSKGIPHKNIAPLAGKPLIAWTIEEAKKSKYIDRLILSSEDEDIIKVAKQYGCEVPFIRPKELAQDDTPGVDPIRHAIDTLPEKYDYIVLLQPTSPLRNVDDIDGCIEKCVNEGLPFCVSVCEPGKSPYWMVTLDKKGLMHKLLETKAVRRQDLPTTYAFNGAVYVGETDKFLEENSFITDETAGYIMPPLRSADVDTMLDLKWCEMLMKV